MFQLKGEKCIMSITIFNNIFKFLKLQITYYFDYTDLVLT